MKSKVICEDFNNLKIPYVKSGHQQEAPAKARRRKKFRDEEVTI